ncbi:hypothetical protein IMZ48_15400 [Candidatus Bathyarchaeota archaeon]|nr:hypothetical protein [Candidatus Bathyarchaeota archaeon]
MKAACVEATDGTSEVKDFEVGVFTGEYKTEVPVGYFEHISQLRSDKKNGTGVGGPYLVANSGPTGGPAEGGDAGGPENLEDPRYVGFRTGESGARLLLTGWRM